MKYLPFVHNKHWLQLNWTGFTLFDNIYRSQQLQKLLYINLAIGASPYHRWYWYTFKWETIDSTRFWVAFQLRSFRYQSLLLVSILALHRGIWSFVHSSVHAMQKIFWYLVRKWRISLFRTFFYRFRIEYAKEWPKGCIPLWKPKRHTRKRIFCL